jgi:hypothetical protein
MARGHPSLERLHAVSLRLAGLSEPQILLAAEVNVDSPDGGHLEPTVEATVSELKRADTGEQPKVAVADAGYWHHEQLNSLAAGGIAVLIPSDAKKAKGRPPWLARLLLRMMRRVLATELGERFYRKRSRTVDPMFGHAKHNRERAGFTDAAGRPCAPSGA